MATWIEKLYWSAFTVWHSRGERRSLCPCGRTLPTLERLDGRMEDVIVLPDGEAAHESVVLPKLYGVPGVLQIQIFQQTCSEVVIRAVGASDTDDAALRKGLRKAFREAVGGAEGLALTIELVKDIPFLGGKIQGNPIELQMITEFPVLLIPLHPPAEFLGSMP